MPRSDADKLAKYRRMRSASDTPEPFGGGRGRKGLFVIQKHGATRLHYDFRLELDGVLKSWAVPRGPSFDPAIKRLAVHVEDHPIEYADFEGVIPEGNYGAGAVIVWDQGQWRPVDDPVEGLRKGKLVFELLGHKLRGEWTLVRTKKERSEIKGSESKEWLLIKHTDAWAGPRELDEASIFSGLTLEELEQGADRAAVLRTELDALLDTQKAERALIRVDDVEAMLAEVRTEPFDGDDWIFELKYDGYRLLASKDEKGAHLRYRSGIDATHVFPEIRRALRLQPYERLILDGEVVVLDEAARPVFNHLQKRVQLTRQADIEQAAVQYPAVLYVFDLIAFEDYDLRRLSTVERKRLLRRVLPAAGALRFADHVEATGRALFEQVRAHGLEGIVAKRADAPYRAGRSPAWIKIRIEHTADFVIVGFSGPKGSRAGFGALHLGVYEQDSAGAARLVYAGRVGTGFTDAQLTDIRAELDTLVVDAPAVTVHAQLPTRAGHFWVRPELVCEVRYKERTRDGLLRHPAFLRMRPDKPPMDCVWADPDERMPVPSAEDAPPDAGAGDEPSDGSSDGLNDGASDVSNDRPAAVPANEANERTVNFTNLDKVFWPADAETPAYTKGDLIDFYGRVSPWLLPYLRDRPLVLTRYPDGIDGKSFFQKDAPAWVPDWLRLERMWSADADREIDYFVCDDVETLVFLVNLGTIPLHVWSSRIRNLSRPDWSIIDLDPKGAPFTDVVRIARAVKDLCDAAEIETFVKTSGSSGLHVLVPLGAQVTYEQSRAFAELVARIIAARLPDIATTVRQVGRRGGRVYLDYLQNGHGRLLVSPFCVRPLPGAPVSTTLLWDEVDERLDIRAFTIETVVPRLEAMGDPMARVLEVVPDLRAALEKLAGQVG